MKSILDWPAAQQLAYNPYKIFVFLKTKFSHTVMVLGCVSNEGDIMLHHIFLQCPRLNCLCCIAENRGQAFVRKRVSWKTICVAAWFSSLAYPPGRIRNGCQIIFTTSSLLTSLIAIPWIMTWGVRLRKTLTALSIIPTPIWSTVLSRKLRLSLGHCEDRICQILESDRGYGRY